MSRIDDIANNSKVSEKSTERYLIQEVKKRGGICLKYDNPHEAGYPDRIVVLPWKAAFWVELKSKGKKLRPLQRQRHEALESIGQEVYVADNREIIDKILSKYD